MKPISFVLRAAMLFLCASATADTLPSSTWKKLDRFEAHTLAMADQAFEKKLYREAIPKYNAFLLQYPRSAAVAYAMLKRGRSLQLDDKRNEAIHSYDEVMDYYPNNLPIASAALYHTGEAHWQNGDVEKAMKAWLEMATDKDYRQHPLAARAINSLADNLMKQHSAAQAVGYFERVAVEFRHKNPEPARYALGNVVHHHVRTVPNEPKLRDFYRKVGSFDRRPQHFPETTDLAADRSYWRSVWERVWHEGRNSFPGSQKRERMAFFKYWADVFEPRMPHWEEFQIHAAKLRLEATGNTEQWFLRMDELYAAESNEDKTDRTLRWIRMFQGHGKKVMEYCDKLDCAQLDIRRIRVLMDILARDNLAAPVFARIYKRFTFGTMSNNDIRELALIAYERLGDIGLGSSLVTKLKLTGMSDDEKSGLHRSIAKFDPTLVKGICANFDDADRGKFELLVFYHDLRDGPKAAGPHSLDMTEVRKERMALADELVGHETYAPRAWWMKARFLHWDSKFAEAIPCYRSADNPPDNTWAIVECLVGLGEVDRAINELREIENYYRKLAPRAAYAMATVYRQAGRKDDEVTALRRVLKKYPEADESCQAHVRLEHLKVRHISGGVNAT